MATKSPQNHSEPNPNSASSSQFLFINRRCCFFIPYRWRKARTPSPNHNSQQNLWSQGLNAFNNIRRWPEIVSGPRWKTFIRHKTFTRQSSKFQYDPLAYALNFDQGALEYGDSQMENEYMVRNFSSRYASPTVISIGSKTSVDGGKDLIGSNCV